MLGGDLSAALTPADVWPALVVVLVPLGAATVFERRIEARVERVVVRARLAWWPVQLLALVGFLIAGAVAQPEWGSCTIPTDPSGADPSRPTRIASRARSPDARIDAVSVACDDHRSP